MYGVSKKLHVQFRKVLISIGLGLGTLLLTGCSQDYKGLFTRLPTQEVFFPNGEKDIVLRLPVIIPEALDLLIMLEHSNAVSAQQKTDLATTFTGIADAYINATNDIQVTVVPSDFWSDSVANNQIPGHIPIIRSKPPSNTDANEFLTDQKNTFKSISTVDNTGSPSNTKTFLSLTRFLQMNENRTACRTVPASDTCLFRKNTKRVIVLIAPTCDNTDWVSGYIQSVCPQNPAHSEAPGDITTRNYLTTTQPYNLTANPPQYIMMQSIGQDYLSAIDMTHYLRTLLNSLDNSASNGSVGTPPPNTDMKLFMLAIGLPAVKCGMQGYSNYFQDRLISSVKSGGSFLSTIPVNSLASKTDFLDISERSIPNLISNLEKNIDAQTQEKATDFPPFTLKGVPSSAYTLEFYLVHANGSEELIPPKAYRFAQQQLTLIDVQWINNILPTDSFRVVYVPQTSVETKS